MSKPAMSHLDALIFAWYPCGQAEARPLRHLPMDLQYVIFFAILLSSSWSCESAPGVTGHCNADRWLRWIIFPIVGAWLCRHFELMTPMWAIAAAGFLVWFLVETLYKLAGHRGAQREPLPPLPALYDQQQRRRMAGAAKVPQDSRMASRPGFPPDSGAQGRSGRRHLPAGFDLSGRGALLRIQVTFLPQNNGAIDVCYSLTSTTWTRRGTSRTTFISRSGGSIPRPGLWTGALLQVASAACGASPFKDRLDGARPRAGPRGTHCRPQ